MAKPNSSNNAPIEELRKVVEGGVESLNDTMIGLPARRCFFKKLNNTNPDAFVYVSGTISFNNIFIEVIGLQDHSKDYLFSGDYQYKFASWEWQPGTLIKSRVLFEGLVVIVRDVTSLEVFSLLFCSFKREKIKIYLLLSHLHFYTTEILNFHAGFLL